MKSIIINVKAGVHILKSHISHIFLKYIFFCIFLKVSTDQGMVQMFDARQDKKSLWTLNAHSEGVNGMSLSTQCPDCLITASSDKTVKVWDISESNPTFVLERDPKLGTLHCLDGCPDAPFVVVAGGDKPDNNLKVFDIRENAAVRSRFGSRELKNPLNFASFGYSTANDAEPSVSSEPNILRNDSGDKMIEKFNDPKSQDIEMADSNNSFPKPASGGAAKKFLNKKKKKKKKEF